MNRTSVLPASEAQFQRAVIDLARRTSWRVHHAHDSRRQVRPGVLVGDTDAAGFPDLVLCRPPRLIVAELKTGTGRIRPAQRAWLDVLADVPGVEVFVWRPDDLPAIVEVLAR